MQRNRHLTVVALLCAVFASTALLSTTSPIHAQLGKKKKKGDLPPPPPPEGSSLATQFSAIKLIENDEFQRYLDLGRECIDGKSWDRAVTTLQAILNSKEDYYAQVKRPDPQTGEERVRSTSVKYEANRLLGTMPKDGLEVYEARVGGDARDLLAKAKRNGDREILADVAHRFMHTHAGKEANDLLATTFLDRGQFFTAALRYDRLIQDERIKASDLMLFKAAFAYRRAGDADNSERIWKMLQKRIGNNGIKLGEQTVSTSALRDALDKIVVQGPANPHDWIMVGGDITRAAQAKGSPPLLDEILWSRKTVQDKSDETGDVDRGAEARAMIDSAIGDMNKRGVPIMPGSFPIAAGKKMIYRTYGGLTAVNLEDFKDDKGEVIAKAGSIEWKSTDFDGALATILSDPSTRTTIDTWLRQVYFQSGFINLVYENSAVGTLSTDHRLVYTVDDLAVPAPPAYLNPQLWNSPQVADKVKPLVKGNSLQAFEVDSGKIAFRMGDPSKNNDEFAGTHFLGVPLVVGGRLYVLNEKNDGELRLMCIEPRRNGDKWTPVIVPPVQVLGKVAEHHRVTHDIARRSTAVHLAYGEGILVCPTNAGEILGVDLMSRTLAWSYPYRQSAPHPESMRQGPQFQQPNLRIALTYANYKVSPPFIVNGKVVFAAPDSSAVHCINLRDGTPAWVSRQQDNDLFLAGVYDGKVVIVGKNSVRFLRLADGIPIGEPIATGELPSGQGVASNNVYYLPLRNSEILAIDVAKGQIKARNRPAKAGTPPGNLVFYEGAVLSQTIDQVIAYPQLTARLARADKALQADPDNLAKRTERGEYYLRDGQVHKAVDDLRTVALKKPDGDLAKRVRNSLYEAFTDLMLVDFKNAREKFWKEYEELCLVEGNQAEQEQRQARALRILGQGLEGENNLVDAFTAYRRFGSLPLFAKEGIPSVDDPKQKIPTHVWLRGRVMAMLANAPPEAKRPLEAKIAEEWRIVEAKKDPDAIRSFIGMFDVPFEVGREARLKLAEAIIERKDDKNYLEAELYLLQLRVTGLRQDVKVGGAALETLARLEMAKAGKPEAIRQALEYYRDLGREFPDAAVRDGKTGKELLKRALEDPRFHAFRTDEETLWAKAELKGREAAPIPHANIPAGLQGFLFQPTGDLTPFLKQHRLLLDPVNSSNPVLRVLDTATNSVRGTPITLGNVSTNYMFFRHLYDQAERNTAYYPDARFRFYKGKGHLAVFQVGTMVYGIDLANTKLLWSHSLLEVNQIQPGMMVQPDAQGTLWLVFNDPSGRQTTRSQVGHVGAVEASYVAVTTQKGLVALDPIKGNVMWTKQNVPATAEVFGDDKHIYVVNTTASGITGPSWVLRASDGSLVEARDFTFAYRNKVRVLGNKILVADPAGGNLTLRLYDVLTGKDLYKKTFEGKTTLLRTEDEYLTGAIDANGKVTAVDLRTQKEVLKEASVIHGRITLDDVKNLDKPLLLEDGERFYLALNHPIEQTQVAGGVLANNFGNGLRCHVVNGWVCAIDKKGEFLWHPMEKTTNQMIVLEQFRRLPLLLFSARYTEQIQGGRGGQRMVSWTGSIDKQSGKMIYWPTEAAPSNGNARFYGFNVDVKAGTINMFGYSGIVQHYLDDGRKPPEPGAGLKPNPDAKGRPMPGAGLPQLPNLDKLPPEERARILREFQQLQREIERLREVEKQIPGREIPPELRQQLQAREAETIRRLEELVRQVEQQMRRK